MYMNTPEGHKRYQKASNDYDMLKGCVNRMFITDDREELPRLYESAKRYLDLIYDYGCKRMDCLMQENDSKRLEEHGTEKT